MLGDASIKYFSSRSKVNQGALPGFRNSTFGEPFMKRNRKQKPPLRWSPKSGPMIRRVAARFHARRCSGRTE